MSFVLRPYPTSVSEKDRDTLVRELGISPLAADLLCRRGITDASTAKAFFSPRLACLPSPFTMLHMEEAVDLITRAMEERRPVLVYGDYDVDGVCATALLVDFLKKLQLNVSWYIPNRLSEGYGLCRDTLHSLAGRYGTPPLLITVDNGISAREEVRLARELGFQVLITDHHEPPAELPGAEVIINPRQPGCDFPCKDLCGAGVAFFLIGALRSALRERGYWEKREEPDLRDSLDLVAMGTVADVMSLAGINRILVRAGTEILSRKKRPGVMALCELAGLSEGQVTAEDISYRLGPRINAAGRMGSPQVAAELFLCEDMAEARVFAEELERMNLQRREIEAEILPQAIEQCTEYIHAQGEEGAKGLVVYGPGWHQGVIGIVASKLADRFCRPVVVLTDDQLRKDIIKGSGRTDGSANLYAAVNGCAHLLEKFGGHPKAVGLALKKNQLEEFRDVFNGQVRALETENAEGAGQVVVDHITDGRDVDARLLSLLQYFEPFGEDNPEPVFLATASRLGDVALVKGEHLRFSLRLNGKTFRGIGFGMGSHLDLAREGVVDLAFTFRHSVYRGEQRVELMAQAISSTDNTTS